MNHQQQNAIIQLEAIEQSGAAHALRIRAVRAERSENHFICAEVEVRCDVYENQPGGLALNASEPFHIWIPDRFPFVIPSVWTPHTRFAGCAHVQWKRHLCLYQSPGTEWIPADGMFGLMGRLDSWLREAALGRLDPADLPLHPPVAYATDGTPIIVVQADAPDAAGSPWLGLAQLARVSEHRLDLTGWHSLDNLRAFETSSIALLLAEPLPFEYPRLVLELLTELGTRGAPMQESLQILKCGAGLSQFDQPFFIVVGSPMRRVQAGATLHQHLAVWRIPTDVANHLRTIVRPTEPALDPAAIVEAVARWASAAPVEWCQTLENRPQVTRRRDESSKMRWFAGKTVLLLGCGALGSYVADFLARAGVQKIVLMDKARVTPGIIVRQLFCDEDIGTFKAAALALRMRSIQPGMEVEALTRDVLACEANELAALAGDVIIDATASGQVLSWLESCRQSGGFPRVPVASLAIGHEADRGIIAVAGARYSGGSLDVSRRAKLTALSRTALRSYANEFWPREHRAVFQPEPGCSEPTFVGSAVDVAVLCGMMLNSCSEFLASSAERMAAVSFVRAPDKEADDDPTRLDEFFAPDRRFLDPHAGYEIRLSEAAWAQLTTLIRDARERAGRGVETGGLLLGERDDLLRVIWISDVTGPPVDSTASADEFVCGTAGIQALNGERQSETLGSVRVVGLWHSHPTSAPLPSVTDFAGMFEVLGQSSSPIARSLMMIVGMTDVGRPLIGVYEFSRADVEALSTGTFVRVCATTPIDLPEEANARDGGAPRP